MQLIAKRQRGAALITAVIIVVVVAVLGASLGGMFRSETCGAVEQMQGDRAFLAAEAGIAYGVGWLVGACAPTGLPETFGPIVPFGDGKGRFTVRVKEDAAEPGKYLLRADGEAGSGTTLRKRSMEVVRVGCDRISSSNLFSGPNNQLNWIHVPQGMVSPNGTVTFTHTDNNIKSNNTNAGHFPLILPEVTDGSPVTLSYDYELTDGPVDICIDIDLHGGGRLEFGPTDLTTATGTVSLALGTINPAADIKYVEFKVGTSCGGGGGTWSGSLSLLNSCLNSAGCAPSNPMGITNWREVDPNATF